VTGVDWLIVGVVIVLALFGWAQGFVAGVFGLLGFAAGAWVGMRLGPLVLGEGRRSAWAPAFGLIGAVAGGALLALGLGGLGARLGRRLRSPAATAADGLAGAALTACVGLGVAWILGVAALASGGEARRAVQRSAILRQINAVLPPSSGLISTLQRLDPFPHIDGPEAHVPAPPAGIARARGVRGARPSVVKVLGTACGLGVEGSGWVAAPGVVVTNAHVVAGQNDTRVLPGGHQSGLAAHAIAFDPHDDVAVLRAPGLTAPALPVAHNPRGGLAAAILGYPENGPFDVRAGRLGQTREVITQDAYGRGPVRRSIASLRGAVRSGNSGGPMVDAAGEVVATVFAATTSGSRGGFAVPNSVVRAVLRGARAEVSTGACAG